MSHPTESPESGLHFGKFFDARGVVDVAPDTDGDACEDMVEVTDLDSRGTEHTRVVLEAPETEGLAAGEPLFYMVLLDDGVEDPADGEGIEAVSLLHVEFHGGPAPEDSIDVSGVSEGDLLAILVDRLKWRVASSDDTEALPALEAALRHLESAASTLCVGR